MPIVNFDIINKAGTVSHETLEVDSGTTWQINSTIPSIITIGDTEVTANPSQGWVFRGNWGQPDGTTSGTITEDTTFSADFINLPPSYLLTPAGGPHPCFVFKWAGNINYVLDNYGNNGAENAPVYLVARNYSASQDFFLIKSGTYPDIEDYTMIRTCQYKSALYANGTLPLIDQHLVLRQGNYSRGECEWKFVPIEGQEIKFNGCTYQTYRIVWAANNGYSVDNESAWAADVNRIVLYSNNDDSEAQHWLPLKNSLVRDLPVPTIKTLNDFTMQLNTKKILNYVLSGHTNYQLWMRHRTLPHNSDVWGEWSVFYNRDGLTSDGGLGDAWSPNTNANDSIDISGANTTKQIDSIEYEIRCSSFGLQDNGIWGLFPVRSNHTTIVQKTKQQVSTDLDSNIVLSKDFMALNISSNNYRCVQKATVKIDEITIDGRKLTESKEFKDVDVTGDIELHYPMNELLFFPENGNRIKVSYEIDYNDPDYLTNISQKTEESIISFTGGTLTPTLWIEYINPYDIAFNVQNADITKASLSIIYEHNGDKIIRQITPESTNFKLFKVPAPLNTDFDVSVTVENDTEWGTKLFRVRETTIDSDFVWQRTKALVLNAEKLEIAFDVFKDSQPNDYSSEAGLNEISLEGKRYGDYYKSTIENNALNINGIVLDTGSQKLLGQIKEKGYCLYRDDKGNAYNVMIKSINVTRANKHYNYVDIAMVETNHEVSVILPS